MTDRKIHAPQCAQDRRRAGRRRRRRQPGAVRQAWAQAAPWQARGRRQDPAAALETLHPDRGRRFHGARRGLQQGHRRRRARCCNESLDDVQPKASVAANTGQGPDMFWGLYSLPHLFPDKLRRRHRRRRLPGQEVRRLGADARVTYGKSGGKWIDIPVAYNGNVINYRQSMIEKAGFKEVPKDNAGFLELMKALKAKSDAGRLRARPRVGRRQRLGALGAVVATAATWSTRTTR